MKSAPHPMLLPSLTLLLLLLLLAAGSALARDAFPDISQLPSKSALPEALAMSDGGLVTSKKEWLKKRRPELKALFQHYMYGRMPPRPSHMQFSLERVDRGLFNGKATEKEITITLGTNNAPRIHLLLVVPNHRTKPAPVFVGLNFCGNHAVLADPAVPLP